MKRDLSILIYTNSLLACLSFNACSYQKNLFKSAIQYNNLEHCDRFSLCEEHPEEAQDSTTYPNTGIPVRHGICVDQREMGRILFRALVFVLLAQGIEPGALCV